MIRILLALLLCPVVTLARLKCNDGSQCPDESKCCESYTGYDCCPKGWICSHLFRICVPTFALNHPMTLLSKKLIFALRTTNPKDVICDNKTSCPDGSTCCRKLTSGFTCCPKGTFCEPFVRSCIPIEDRMRRLDFSSKLIEDPRRFFSRSYISCPGGMSCPYQMTCCGSSCCPFPNAVCCSGMSICCPSGFQCDPNGERCIGKNEMSLPLTPNTISTSRSEAGVVTCADKSQCFDERSCCLDLKGEFNCCPVGTSCDPNYGICASTAYRRFGPFLLKKLFLTRSSVSVLLSESSSCAGGRPCPAKSTCCHNICCPIPDTLCCKNGSHCCPRRGNFGVSKQYLHAPRVVVPKYERGGGSNTGSVGFSTSKGASHLKEKIIYCPGGKYYCPDYNTCCLQPGGLWLCCPYRNATCCTEELPCCPTGMKCIASKNMCIPESKEKSQI